ncbi:acetate/propionate family kinase [Aquella oligotrophica]|uniref:Acetate kinase n=1 Tax=Aquella oligotrophica TaxID=2067065 RepID=A0A2I7N8F6_9NEIS|nr:acetate/propionate family kinase [Aquella oligotrophica]AUR52743.1 acetate kinase [Aquella oligotrophica]
MKNAVIVINSGSTSLKFALYTVEGSDLAILADGSYTGMPQNTHIKIKDARSKVIEEKDFTNDIMNHEKALSLLIPKLEELFPDVEVKYAGHRVVSGGERFMDAVRLDGEIIDYLEQLSEIEPTHQHFEVMGARALAKVFPDIIQTASFDTSFHRTMPKVAEFYAVPEEITKHGVRHWGFHGISYAYISTQLAKLVPQARRAIVAHLGGGASLCAMLDNKSVDTTMQFGAITGLVMATRSGDFPADALLYLLKKEIYTPQEFEILLSKKSGLLALSDNLSESMQIIEDSDSEAAAYAREKFDYMLLKYLGAYTAILGGLDVLVFTAGIGENDARLRTRICEKLGWLGISLDESANNQAIGGEAVKISSSNSRVEVYVIPTNEELMIARSTLEIVQNT